MFGLDLAAHSLHCIRRRSDPNQAGINARLRKRCTLGEEAVAGMDRIGAHLARGGQHCIDIEVGFGSRCGPDAACIVHKLQMIRIGVGL